MSDAFRTSAPPPGPPRPYHFPHIERRSLSNGLKILVAENHNAPVVAVRALVCSGADRDTPQLAGLASMTAELLDEGAGSRDTIRLAEDLGLLGASLGSGTDWDATYVTIDVLSKNLNASLEIFADVVRRPMLPDSALERMRSERMMELLQQREEPAAIAGKRFSNLLYGNGTYGNSVIGNADSVSRLSI
jgi:zinc protease